MIQFKEVVNLKEIQLLSHESKIPQRIEIFTYVPTNPIEVISPERLHSLEFKRLGHISFDSNKRSNHSARELKSVYVNFLAYFLKLEINKCYTNGFNNFKQVSIISIKCITSKPQLQNSPELIDPLSQQDEKVEIKAEEIPKIVKTKKIDMDSVTMKKLKDLEDEKQEAVQMENFDEASRLKRIIEKLKEAGKELLELELKKREAVAIEDYEAAKKYKLELEKRRDSILDKEKIKHKINRVEPQVVAYREDNRSQQDIETHSILQTLTRETKMPELVTVHSPEQPEIVQKEENYEEINEQEEESEEEYMESYDDKIPPAVLRKFRGEEEQEVKDEEPPVKRGQPEPLSKQILIIAEAYTAIFSMSLLELLFSKHYYLREEGLDIITEEVTKKTYKKVLSSDPERILNAIIDITVMMVQSKITPLGIKALTLLLFSMVQYNVDKKSSILNSTIMEQMLDSLIDRLGDGSNALNNKLEETLLGMVNKGCITLNILIDRLVRNSEKANKLPKYATKRCDFLIQIMKSYATVVKNELIKTVIDYGLLGLRNMNRNIRLEGCKVLVEVYRMVGGKLYDHFPTLATAQNKILNDELKKAFGDKVLLRQPEVEEHKPVKKVVKKKKSPSPPKK